MAGLNKKIFKKRYSFAFSENILQAIKLYHTTLNL